MLMRKLILLVFASTLASFVYAQHAGAKLKLPMAIKTRFGLRGGVNLANLRVKDITTGSGERIDAKHRTAFHAGVFVNFPIGSQFRLQPELSFSSQGGKLQNPFGSGTTTHSEQTHHYIILPVNVQWQSPGGIFAEAGPQLGYLWSAAVKDAPGSAASYDNKGTFDKIDFAWGAGLGYLSRIGLGLSFRYFWGRTNILKDNSSGTGIMKNRVRQISLVYHFGAAR